MESVFQLTKDNFCRYSIIDQSIFPKESTVTQFTHDDSAIINVLVKNTSSGDNLLLGEAIKLKDNKRRSIQFGYIETELQGSNPQSDYIAQESNEASLFSLPNDGKYIVYHIILPTIEWINKFKPQDLYSKYSFVYFYQDGAIKKTNDGETYTDVQYQELIQRNPVGTTIIKASKVDFSTCFLWKCFINYCKIIFKQNKNKCIVKDSDLIFKRDFVWMTINVIKYYIDLGQMEEAQRILEEVIYCNGFCTPTIIINQAHVQGCNCGSKM